MIFILQQFIFVYIRAIIYPITMKIKLTLLICLMFSLSLSLSAQDYKTNIEKDFKHLNDLLLSGKYEQAMDLFPERIFEVASREELAAAFSLVLNNKDFKAAILDYKVLDITAPEKIDGQFYSALRYSTTMTMFFTPPDEESAGDKALRLTRLKTAFANAFGSEHVSLNEQTGVFTMTPAKKSYAISANGTTEWKFVNVESSQRIIMEKLLPKQILERELN